MKNNNGDNLENDLSDVNIKRESYISVLSDFRNDLAELNIDEKKGDAEFKNLYELISDIKMNIDSLNKTVSEPFKAAVVGEQGVGKSTIINLLIEEDLMPHSYNQNELAIIKTVFTEDKLLNKTAKIVYLPDSNGVQETENLTYEEFLNLIDDARSSELLVNPKYKDKVEYFELFSTNDNLKDVQVINTPGVNVLTSNFYEKVRHLFTEADIIIWVFSRNNMLNKFNKEKINEIYKDNNNIIGIISKSDLLFGQDQESGVKDVIEQFLNEIENGILYRVNRDGQNLISLFPYNGKAALIASDLENNILINDADNIEVQEEKEIMMLWNYYYHGYPYISDGKDIRYELNLYTSDDSHPVQSIDPKIKYNSEIFLDELLTNNFVEKVKDSDANYKIIYTDKGKDFLMRCSQVSDINHFANNYIFSRKLADKLINIKDRFNLFYSDSNKLTLLENINSEYENKLKNINNDFDLERENLEQNINDLTDRYKEWSDNRISVTVKTKGSMLINDIVTKMDSEIDRTEMAKEIWNLIKSQFGGDKEGPAIKKIQNICEKSIFKIVDDSIDDITANAFEEIDNIMKEFKYKGDSIESIKINIPDSHTRIIIKNPTPKIDIPKILEKLKPLLKTAIVKLAQKDLRKRMPQILKKMIMVLRSLLKKIGWDFAKKRAAKSAGKSAAGPLSILLILYDLYDIPKSIYDMLGDMKKQIKEDLESNNSEFTECIRDIFSKIYSDILYQTIIKLREELKIDDVRVMELQYVLNISSQMKSIFQKYQNSLK